MPRRPGAGGFVTAKLNGTRQVWLVATDGYARPVPEPIGQLPPVSATCQQCHRPERFIGDRVEMIYDHANDAANKETTTKVTLHVGGPMGASGSGVGIHWHANPANVVGYAVLNDTHDPIPYVRVTPDGHVRQFSADGANQADLRARPLHRMDCFDCHNPRRTRSRRPRHLRSMGQSATDSSARRFRSFAARRCVLNATYPSQDVAVTQIERQLRAAITSEPQSGYTAADLQRAIDQTQTIYRTNIFPSMKVGWGTYPNQL